MSVSKLCSYWFLLFLFFSSACSLDTLTKPDEPKMEKLTVKSDGTMEFRKRTLPEKDVIIYPDGSGGERAAIKVYDPMHPDYYRDSIRVERVPESEVEQTEMD